MNINPISLHGNWKEGYALDLHTLHSTPIYGPIQSFKLIDGDFVHQNTEEKIIGYDTKRPEIAEQLYQFKYKSKKEYINPIAIEAANFLQTMPLWKIDIIVPIPPSNQNRSFQPVYELAKQIGILNNINIDFEVLKKVKSTSQLKEIEDIRQRKEELKNAFDTDWNSLSGLNVLIFDDLYRSGSTLEAASNTLGLKGNAENIYVLTITKTRTRR